MTITVHDCVCQLRLNRFLLRRGVLRLGLFFMLNTKAWLSRFNKIKVIKLLTFKLLWHYITGNLALKLLSLLRLQKMHADQNLFKFSKIFVSKPLSKSATARQTVKRQVNKLWLIVNLLTPAWSKWVCVYVFFFNCCLFCWCTCTKCK